MRKISWSKDVIEARPYSSPPESTSNVDQNALLDHTLRLKEWLNEKQVKFIQVSLLIENDALSHIDFPHRRSHNWC